MNRKIAERWLSAHMDGELPARRRARLEACLAADPELRDLRRTWESLGARCRGDAVELSPSEIERAWYDVRRVIRGAAQQPVAERPGLTARMQWAGAWAAVLLVAATGWWWWQGAATVPGGGIALADRTEVEWVETDLPDAMTMVYEHDETGLTVIWVLMGDDDEERDHAG